MAHVSADRVRDTSTSTGTGTFVVSGTAPTAFRTFSAVLSTNDTFYYAIQHQTANEWEIGLGTYSSANTITRTTVYASSAGGSAVTFSSGTKDVFITLAATRSVQLDNNGAIPGIIDAGNLTFTGTARRITGTFDGTTANRLMFKSSATNGTTSVGAVPDGAGNFGGFSGYNASDPGNSSVASIQAASTEAQVVSTRTGTGTYLPMTFYTGGSERMRVDTSGNVGIGATAGAGIRLQIQQDQAAYTYCDLVNVTNGGGAVFRQIVRNIANTGTTSVDYAKLIGSGLAINNNDTNAANFTSFGVGGTERMRIDASGNVGVGTSSPGAKLGLTTTAASAGWQVRVNNNGVSNDTGIYADASNNMEFAARNGSGTLTVRIGSSGDSYINAGNVGIGTSSPSALAKLDVVGNIRINGNNIIGGANNSSVGMFAGTAFNTGGASVSLRGISNGYNDGGMEFYTGAGATGAERARIDASGNLFINRTSQISTEYFGITFNGASRGGMYPYSTTTATSYHMTFGNPNGAVGSIYTSGTTTGFATSSDYRLKNSVASLTTGLATIAVLNPVTYKWNADDSDGEGFIAHELQEVIPHAVTGEKDAINEDGSIKPQGVDYSKIVVHLVAAIQELSAKVAALEAKQ
jgi:hypothetical protein